MPAPDPRIDAYIAKSADFARPLLIELRARLHAACPEAEETMKWSAPSFVYRGKILAIMASFKQHVAFNLWQGAQLVEQSSATKEGMGQFGRIASAKDLPGKREMARYIKQAMALIDAGQGAGGTRSSAPKPPIEPPRDLLDALASNPAAQATFDGFPPGKRRDYVEWITGAKREDTRARRVAQAVAWLAEGKARNWKYENC